MADYTYLVTDIKNTAEDDSTEFLDQIPKLVNKAENRLIRELDDVGLNSFSSVAVSTSNPFVSLPSGTRIMRNFSITTGGSKINLLPRTVEFINDYWPYVSSSIGEPRYYGMRTNTQIVIAPTPASVHDGEVYYVSRPTTLSSAAPNNYFSDFCYDALFYASMIEASFFTKSFDTIAMWQSEYTTAIDGLRNQARRTRQDDMAQAASPAGSADTLVQGSS
mgnify:CR=1 FL=1